MSTMPLPDAPSAGAGTPARTSPRGTSIVVGVTAFLLQAVTLFATISLGLFWGMWLYFVAIGQTVLGFGVIGWLLFRRRLVLALLVPFICAASTLALLGLTNVFWPERLTP